MARAGASVVVVARTKGPLEATTAQIRALGGCALPIVADVTRVDEVERAGDAAVAEFGYIDCWVSNAGSADREDFGPLIDMSEER